VHKLVENREGARSIPAILPRSIASYHMPHLDGFRRMRKRQLMRILTEGVRTSFSFMIFPGWRSMVVPNGYHLPWHGHLAGRPDIDRLTSHCEVHWRYYSPAHCRCGSRYRKQPRCQISRTTVEPSSTTMLWTTVRSP